jgi:hypothetical protein
LHDPYVCPKFPRESIEKNYYAFKESNFALFPNANRTIVGILTIDKIKKRKANAFKVINNRVGPRPISF